MLRRTGSRFHRLLQELHPKPGGQPQPRAEQVPQVDPVEEADVEPHCRLLRALAAHPRAVAWRTGLGTARSPRAS